MCDPFLEECFWTYREFRVPEGCRPAEDEEWAKETLTRLFLLLTRRRRPMRACCARRNLDIGGLSGLLSTS